MENDKKEQKEIAELLLRILRCALINLILFIFWHALCHQVNVLAEETAALTSVLKQ